MVAANYESAQPHTNLLGKEDNHNKDKDKESKYEHEDKLAIEFGLVSVNLEEGLDMIKFANQPWQGRSKIVHLNPQIVDKTILTAKCLLRSKKNTQYFGFHLNSIFIKSIILCHQTHYLKISSSCPSSKLHANQLS